MGTPVVLLGPQRPDPNLRQALDALDVAGPVVALTAGWRHDEAEVDPLRAHVGRDLVVLPLYRWFDEARLRAPAVATAYRARQARIQQHKALYRLRLHPALQSVRDLWLRLAADPELVGPVLDQATEVVRGIDAATLAAVDSLREATAEVLSARFDDPWIAERRAAIADAIAGAGAVLVAGGHVAVLRNRMLFFGVEHALGERLARGGPVFAWGAGGMVLTERIVLFYDEPPEGPSEPQILDHGLGLVPDVVLFPHARERLTLGAHDRVAALARRFAPGPCLGLEHGAWLEHTASGWRNRGRPGSACHLRVDGAVVPLEAP